MRVTCGFSLGVGPFWRSSINFLIIDLIKLWGYLSSKNNRASFLHPWVKAFIEEERRYALYSIVCMSSFHSTQLYILIMVSRRNRNVDFIALTFITKFLKMKMKFVSQLLRFWFPIFSLTHRIRAVLRLTGKSIEKLFQNLVSFHSLKKNLLSLYNQNFSHCLRGDSIHCCQFFFQKGLRTFVPLRKEKTP